MAGLAITVRDLRLSYRTASGGRFTALDIPAFDVAAGAGVAVTGPSGSGKTSLLYALSGLERPERGSVLVGGTELAGLGEGARDRWRRTHVGFIFQDFHLFPGLDALGNALLPATFRHAAPTKAERARAAELLERVGIRDPRQPVETLSRGEMQRVAVARALLFRPPLVLADEPTASLDAAAASAVTGLLLELCAEAGSTLVAVTHDRTLAGRIGAECRLAGGHVETGVREDPGKGAVAPSLTPTGPSCSTPSPSSSPTSAATPAACWPSCCSSRWRWRWAWR